MNDNISIQDRTKKFGIRIIKASQWLIEQGGVSKILASQILRSGTSVGANAHEAKSKQFTIHNSEFTVHNWLWLVSCELWIEKG